jgi:hypothetical protein
MKRICDLQIAPISNTRIFIYVLSCIIVDLLQGRVMEQPFYKHRPRLYMTQFYEGIGPIAFEGR